MISMKYKITIWDNSPQNFDIRNPSVKLMEMAIDVYRHDNLEPKGSLLSALRLMYPSKDVEINVSRLANVPALKTALDIAVKELTASGSLQVVERISQLTSEPDSSVIVP